MFLRSFVLLLLLFISLGVRAETLLHDLAVLPDPDGTLTIEAVAATDPGQFKPLPAGSFAGGFTRSVHWFRFTIARAGETWIDLQPPVLDDLRLFAPDAAAPDGWRERRTGDTRHSPRVKYPIAASSSSSIMSTMRRVPTTCGCKPPAPRYCHRACGPPMPSLPPARLKAAC